MDSKLIRIMKETYAVRAGFVSGRDGGEGSPSLDQLCLEVGARHRRHKQEQRLRARGAATLLEAQGR